MELNLTFPPSPFQTCFCAWKYIASLSFPCLRFSFSWTQSPLKDSGYEIRPPAWCSRACRAGTQASHSGRGPHRGPPVAWGGSKGPHCQILPPSPSKQPTYLYYFDLIFVIQWISNEIVELRNDGSCYLRHDCRGRKGGSRFARLGASGELGWGAETPRSRGTCFLFLPLGITGDGSQHPALLVWHYNVLLVGSGHHGDRGKPSLSQGSSWGNPGTLRTGLLGPSQALEPQSSP